MPLRDHFHPPVSKVASWEAVHGGWPMLIVLSLAPRLPPRFVAHPRVHLGSFAEIDVSAYEKDFAPAMHAGNSNGGMAVWAPSRPTLDVVTDLPAQDEYEVRVYDTERDQRLVAAIELVSPANKDRPEHRQAFVGKCAALLQNQVSVTIVDVVTSPCFQPLRGIARFHRANGSVAGRPNRRPSMRWRAGPQNPAASRAVRGTSRPGCSPCRSASRCRRCRFGLPMTFPFRSIWKRAMKRPARLFAFPDRPPLHRHGRGRPP